MTNTALLAQTQHLSSLTTLRKQAKLKFEGSYACDFGAEISRVHFCTIRSATTFELQYAHLFVEKLAVPCNSRYRAKSSKDTSQNHLRQAPHNFSAEVSKMNEHLTD
ncbi:hypothetical protein [Massilia aquatica]|uniref:Uncharacterized protein n=1 Tax=Massilia aquatica TaxID=2609000 RepID=A0ABX0LYJ8_9BURK|nr:hypothetical protein [Massilia aquatica]NHZ39926.1 hypothetical protein [Massilia aquatica]